MEVLELIFYIIFILSVISFASLAPWVPTRTKDLERIEKIICLQTGESFLEIGCGTAKVSLYLSKKYPNCFITGIELSPVFYLISKLKIIFSGQKNISIIYGNALNLHLGEYDAIYVFGLPETITKKIFPKLHSIKNTNFRFISYCFKMTNNYFQETRDKPENQNSIYKYNLQ